MKGRLAILCATALVSVSGLGACGTVEDEVRNRAQEEVDRQRQRVEDEVEKGRQQVEERVTEEATQLLEDGQ